MNNTETNYGRTLANLAKNIKKARLKKKLRQADMIEFGFSERFIQKLESGNYSPSLYTVHRIAECLGIHISDLLKKS